MNLADRKQPVDRLADGKLTEVIVARQAAR